MYVKQEAEVPPALHWSRPQQAMLCQLALKMLYTVTPAFTEVSFVTASLQPTHEL